MKPAKKVVAKKVVAKKEDKKAMMMKMYKKGMKK